MNNLPLSIFIMLEIQRNSCSYALDFQLLHNNQHLSTYFHFLCTFTVIHPFDHLIIDHQPTSRISKNYHNTNAIIRILHMNIYLHESHTQIPINHHLIQLILHGNSIYIIQSIHVTFLKITYTSNLIPTFIQYQIHQLLQHYILKSQHITNQSWKNQKNTYVILNPNF